MGPVTGLRQINRTAEAAVHPESETIDGAAPVPARATPSPAILERLIKGAHGSPKACGEIRKARFVAASTRAIQHGIHTWQPCSGTNGRGNDRRGTPCRRTQRWRSGVC